MGRYEAPLSGVAHPGASGGHRAGLALDAGADAHRAARAAAASVEHRHAVPEEVEAAAVLVRRA
jgi:hypothetical protein